MPVEEDDRKAAHDKLLIDDRFLAEAGLSALPEAERPNLKRRIYAELESRVGNRLASTLSSDQLDEFDALISQSDNQAARAWLNENVPDYRKVVREEHAKIKEELAVAAPAILHEIELYP